MQGAIYRASVTTFCLFFLGVIALVKFSRLSFLGFSFSVVSVIHGIFVFQKRDKA